MTWLQIRDELDIAAMFIFVFASCVFVALRWWIAVLKHDNKLKYPHSRLITWIQVFVSVVVVPAAIYFHDSWPAMIFCGLSVTTLSSIVDGVNEI
jgi:hypothetical protein